MTEHYNMHSHIEELIERKEKADLNGGQEKIDRHNKLGFYTARQRIGKLVELETFMEIEKLAHFDQQGVVCKCRCNGFIMLLAKVNSRSVVIQAADKTVFAGTE